MIGYFSKTSLQNRTGELAIQGVLTSSLKRFKLDTLSEAVVKANHWSHKRTFPPFFPMSSLLHLVWHVVQVSIIRRVRNPLKTRLGSVSLSPLWSFKPSLFKSTYVTISSDMSFPTPFQLVTTSSQKGQSPAQRDSENAVTSEKLTKQTSTIIFFQILARKS